MSGTSSADSAPAVLCLLGPTASGKTDLAMALCDALAAVSGREQPLALISVDSAMVYRNMDIGTAKPTPEQLARYPHALIDICDPAEPFSVADFVRRAEIEIDRALLAGQLPVLVGGTMLYFNALRSGLADIPPVPAAVRSQLEAEWHERGGEALHAELTAVDPVAAQRIHPRNPQRLLRALEVWRHLGRPLSWYWAEQQQQALPRRRGWQWLEVGLMPVWDGIRGRITRRFDAMLAAGLVDEVRQLHARADLNPSLPSIRAVGYRQVWNYLDGQCSYEEMREQAVKATVALARRQRTWMRRFTELTQFTAAADTVEEAALTGAILKYLEAVAIVAPHNKGSGCP
jgi:tRNA dimethylallyltransferase